MSDPKEGHEKDPEKNPPGRTALDQLEQVSRILLVPVTIPIVGALFVFLGNDLINRRQNVVEQKKIDLEYVKVAKDVVSSVTPNADPILINWAYTVLFSLSPVPVAKEDIEELAKRRVPLPSSTPPTVVGGVSSSVKEWPWLVSIYLKENDAFYCNGALIAPKIVLSTANCVVSSEAAELEVKTAVEDRGHVRTDRSIPVAKTIVHPTCSGNPEKDDIALLELETALPGPFVAISSQPSADPKIGEYVRAAVFNFQSEPGNLDQITVPIVDGAKCALAYQKYHIQIASEATICAGFEHGGAAACPGSGSAGAPVVVQDSAGRKYQVGIVALGPNPGPNCEGAGAAYGVYTRISSYADWIRNAVPSVLTEPASEARR
jgi:hypothetical protein